MIEIKKLSFFWAVFVDGSFLYASIPTREIAEEIAASVAGGGPLIFTEYI